MRRSRKSNSARRKPSQTNRIDWLFFALTILLCAFGVLMVFDASVVDAYLTYDDKYHFARSQVIWLGIGFIALIVATLTPIKIIQKLAKPAFIISILLLFLVIIPGIGTKVSGARRWLNIAGFNLQPSEFVKLSVSLFFSSWLSQHVRFRPFVALTGLILILLMLQPDMGTAIVIICIAVGLYYLSGANLKRLIPLLVGGIFLGLLLILSSPYRRERLQTFLDPSIDPLGSSYHIRQVVISLGSGGWYGTGVGRSRQKYQYLPEATTDSIFAVIAEEMGFLGASLVVSTYFFLILRGLRVASQIHQPFPRLLAAGSVIWLASQTSLNLAAMVVLIPLTGIPLPLISYGGSSLISMLAGVGLYLNASRYRHT